MRVARQHHQVFAQAARGGQHGFARGLVAVPGVQVVGDGGLRQDGLLGRREAGRVGARAGHQCGVLAHRNARAGLDGFHQDRRRNVHAPHQHLLAQHLPGGGGCGHLLLQPLRLRAAQQLAAGIAHSGGEAGCVKAGGGEELGVVQLLVARDYAGVEHVQGHEVAERKAAVDQIRLRVAGGHPLVVRLQGRCLAGAEAAFGGGLVVVCTVAPSVVGDFVVVPHGDHGGGGVQGLQVGVALVLGVALAVVGQAEDLLGGRGQAAQCPGVGRCVAALAVFVDVVAQVHGGVQVAALGGMGVHVEVTGGVIGAREHRQLDLRDAARGQGAGAACGGRGCVGAEAVVVGGGGFQPGGIDLDGEVFAGQCRGLALGHEGGEGAVGGHFPFHRNITRVAHRGRDAGPQHHAVGQRVATGDAVGELHSRGVVTTAAGREGQRAQGGGCQAHVAHKATAAGVGLGRVADGVGGGGEFVGHGSGSR